MIGEDVNVTLKHRTTAPLTTKWSLDDTSVVRGRRVRGLRSRQTSLRLPFHKHVTTAGRRDSLKQKRERSRHEPSSSSSIDDDDNNIQTQTGWQPGRQKPPPPPLTATTTTTDPPAAAAAAAAARQSLSQSATTSAQPTERAGKHHHRETCTTTTAPLGNQPHTAACSRLSFCAFSCLVRRRTDCQE